MKRVGVFLFYDQDGFVDEYIAVSLKAFKEHLDYLLVVVNGELEKSEAEKIENIADEVYYRKNVGFDVWGYKEGLNHIGWDRLVKYDELVLFNYTFYAPIFPLEEMFTSSEMQACEFWGITDHKEVTPNPFDGSEVLPRHIQSHFIAIRNSLIKSPEFRKYWDTMPLIGSYQESILKHESRFTKYFSDLGFNFWVYIDSSDYQSDHPVFFEIDHTLEARCPILKRRPFIHEPLFHDKMAVPLRKTLDFVKEHTSYNSNLIWDSILRTSNLRTINTNLDYMEILPDIRRDDAQETWDFGGKIAVIAHLYYAEMTEEIIEQCKKIPCDFDLYISTGAQESSDEITLILSKHGLEKLVYKEVRVVDENRGRDMSSLFITMRDVCLSDNYGLVCRLHSKKSPQVDYSVSRYFKEYLHDALLYNEAYVANLFDILEKDKNIGMVVPPMIFIGHPTMGHSWFTNHEGAFLWSRTLGINVQLDPHSPIAAYGTMYWFRPAALRKMFEYEWKFSDYNVEPNHMDGGLSHIQERLLTYAAQSEGFRTLSILPPNQARQSYMKLEYRLQMLSSYFRNGDPQNQMSEAHHQKLSLNWGVRRKLNFVYNEIENNNFVYLKQKNILKYYLAKIALNIGKINTRLACSIDESIRK